MPLAIPVPEVKPELPLLDWGLPSRETAEAKPGSAIESKTAAAGLRGSRAESSLESALPEESPIPNPQADAGTGEGVSDLAFAARLIQSDAQQGSEELTSSGTPDGAVNTSNETSPGVKASSESLAETAANEVPALTSPAGPTNDNQPAVTAVKTVLPNAESSRNQSGPGGQSEANSVPGEAIPGAAPRENPSNSTAQTKETAAARPADPEPAPAPPVSHDVSLRLADGRNNVDIRMSERGGEIRVTVHTPDGNLANSMRSDLPDLVGKLRQNGYQAETWRPAAPPQTDGERHNGGSSSPQQHSAGARKDGRQQQQQQQQNQPRWVGEWNTSLDPGQESSR